MKDYGSDYPVTLSLPSRSTVACVCAWAVLLFVCISLSLTTLADVASGPVVHTASPPYLAPSPNPPSVVHPSTPELRGVAKLDSSGLLARFEE